MYTAQFTEQKSWSEIVNENISSGAESGEGSYIIRNCTNYGTKNFYYIANLNVGIGHSGSDYGNTASGSNVTGQAEKLTTQEAGQIGSFERFKEWIVTK